MSDTIGEVHKIFSDALVTLEQKNHDYGDAWRKQGWRGNLSRIFEKDQRLRTLLWRSDPRTPLVGDESAVDTLRDMLNTICFAIINLTDGVEWGGEVPVGQSMFTPTYTPPPPPYDTSAPTRYQPNPIAGQYGNPNPADMAPPLENDDQQ